VKMAADGTEEWTETYEGPEQDGDEPASFAAVTETSGGGYLAAGYAITDPVAGKDRWEGWLLKTAADGTEQWSEIYGQKKQQDDLFAVTETSDGGYLAAGETHSFGAGISDGWLVKVGGESPADDTSLADYANDDDIVDTAGLREAIGDWRAGDIDTALLRAVIDAWRSGEPVP